MRFEIAAHIVSKEAPLAGAGFPILRDPGTNWYQELQIWGCDGKVAAVVVPGGGWPLTFPSDLVTERW